MSYEQVKNLEPTEFKCLCGFTPATFEQMLKVVAEKVLAKKRMQSHNTFARGLILIIDVYYSNTLRYLV